MKKFLTLALVGAVVLGLSSVVYANVCAFDAVPAATLLFPFVQYDYVTDGAAGTTLFSITNVSSEAQVVHITLWTDYSVAILDFNLLLTGYDVQTFNIRDILADGVLPGPFAPHNTPNSYWEYGNQGGEPNSDGPVSETNTLNGAWIDGILANPESILGLNCTVGNGHPSEYVGGIDGTILGWFQDWLMVSQGAGARSFGTCGAGNSSITGTWWLDDAFNANRMTWMYITADVVTACNLVFPDDQTGQYFDFLRDNGAEGDGTANVLIGDVIYLDPVGGFSEALNTVHLEADEQLAMVATPLVNPATNLPHPNGWPTSFYSRYASGFNFADWGFREPLGTAWAFRYMNDPAQNAFTYIRAWKGVSWNRKIVDLWGDFGFAYDQTVSHFTALNCLAYTYYAWDEAENVTSITDNPWSFPGGGNEVPNLLPLETQEVSVDEFTLPDNFGWMLFVWPASNFDGLPGSDPNPEFYQTWMGVKYQAFGQYSAALDGALMANYNCFQQQVLPNLGIDFDYVNLNGYTDTFTQ